MSLAGTSMFALESAVRPSERLSAALRRRILEGASR
jgi:hypothetical protein